MPVWLIPALVALAACLLIAAGPVQAVVIATITPKAKLMGAGESVAGTVTVTCDAGFQVVAATFSVGQGGTDGQMPLTDVVCDGKAHRYRATVTARAGSGTFHSGEAFAVAFVYALNQTGEAQRAEETATITLH
jgi:hypothetical protein